MGPSRPSVKTLAVLLALACAGAGQAQKKRAPTQKLSGHTVYEHRSEGGLDYQYSVPKRFEKGACSRLVVICHGTGLDRRWGFANHAHAVFRPDDVVVSVSGPSEGQGGTRLFLGNKKDREAMRAFLREMREVFGCTRVFLYGHSQGGFFVLDYAGAYPRDIAGAVAHASGAWASSATPKALRAVPLAFLHGSSDPVVPYGQSVGSFDAYAGRGMTVQLRRLPFYNHWPNELRAHEMISWCDGMSCETGEEALAAARELLRPKPADRYQWTTSPGYAAARQVLRRFDKGGDLAGEVEAAKTAAKWAAAIEKEGAKHVKAVQKAMGASKGFDVRKGKPWLGALLALRADFRGVDSVESWLASSGYVKAAKAHAKVGDKILRSFYREKNEKKRIPEILRKLPGGVLFDAYPHDLLVTLEGAQERGKALGLSKRELAAKRAFVRKYRDGLYEGAKLASKLWKRWKLP